MHVNKRMQRIDTIIALWKLMFIIINWRDK
jgi:hypothetical protein